MSIDPQVLPQRTLIEELMSAVPEFGWQQPRGILRAVIQSQPDKNTKNIEFIQELAAIIGCTARRLKEAALITDELQKFLAIKPRLYFEDDDGGAGLCVICAKRGVLTRCEDCGPGTKLLGSLSKLKNNSLVILADDDNTYEDYIIYWMAAATE